MRPEDGSSCSNGENVLYVLCSVESEGWRSVRLHRGDCLDSEVVPDLRCRKNLTSRNTHSFVVAGDRITSSVPSEKFIRHHATSYAKGGARRQKNFDCVVCMMEHGSFEYETNVGETGFTVGRECLRRITSSQFRSPRVPLFLLQLGSNLRWSVCASTAANDEDKEFYDERLLSQPYIQLCWAI